MVISLNFRLLLFLFIFSCTPLQQERIRVDFFNFNQDEDILRRYTDVEGVDHLWRINMDTLVFPRDNPLLNQNCYYHGGDVFGGESIKVIVMDGDSTGNGEKHYIIRRVYPHIVEWKEGYRY